MSSSLPFQGQVPPPAEGCTDLFLQVLLVPSYLGTATQGKRHSAEMEHLASPPWSCLSEPLVCVVKLGRGEWFATLSKTSITPSRGLP